MRMIWIILGASLVGLLIAIGNLYINQRKIVFKQQSLDRSADHVRENQPYEITFRRDEVQLHGWLLRPDREHLVIYYGGNAERLSYNIDGFKELDDYAALLVNYRGYGESGGSPTEKNLVADGLSILDEVRDRYKKISILGRSLGTGVAVQVAAQRAVDRLVLVTPFDSVMAVGKRMFPWAPTSLLVKDPFLSIEACANVTAPTLFVLAEEDYVIPRSHSESLAEAWPLEYEWVEVPGSDHNSISEFPLYWKSLREFLGED